MNELKVGNIMNNGPTVKRAFEDPILLSEIVHCPEFLVVRLKTLFETFNSQEFIKIDKLEEFCQKWIDDFHDTHYSWNQLNPTVHMIMYHSPKIVAYIQSFHVTVGVCSEEGAEGANKTYRHDRAHHSRQSGYENQLTDLMNISHNRASVQVQRLLPFPPLQPPKVFRPEVEALLDRDKPILSPPPPPPQPSASGEPMEVDDIIDKPAV